MIGPVLHPSSLCKPTIDHYTMAFLIGSRDGSVGTVDESLTITHSHVNALWDFFSKR